MSVLDDKLTFRVEPFAPQIAAPNVAISPGSGYAANIQMLPMPLYLIVGTNIWQMADQYHVEMQRRIAALENELQRKTDALAAQERTRPFLERGYTFKVFEQKNKNEENFYWRQKQYYWVLLDPWGRIHKRYCPMIGCSSTWGSHELISESTPVVPIDCAFASEPVEQTFNIGDRVRYIKARYGDPDESIGTVLSWTEEGVAVDWGETPPYSDVDPEKRWPPEDLIVVNE